MSTYHNYVAVIGRIPFDDEDSLYLYENMTRQQAVKAFAREMYENTYAEADIEAELERCRCETGCDLGVFVNHVLVSQSPIEEL